jgi:uncharacterized membrane protein
MKTDIAAKGVLTSSLLVALAVGTAMGLVPLILGFLAATSECCEGAEIGFLAWGACVAAVVFVAAGLASAALAREMGRRGAASRKEIWLMSFRRGLVVLLIAGPIAMLAVGSWLS